MVYIQGVTDAYETTENENGCVVHLPFIYDTVTKVMIY